MNLVDRWKTESTVRDRAIDSYDTLSFQGDGRKIRLSKSPCEAREVSRAFLIAMPEDTHGQDGLSLLLSSINLVDKKKTVSVIRDLTI